MKKRVNIENWSFGYDSIQDQTMRLYGVVNGHDNIEDGHNISSSAILNIDYENCEVETLNTIYVLGEPDEDYANKFDLSKFNLK